MARDQAASCSPSPEKEEARPSTRSARSRPSPPYVKLIAPKGLRVRLGITNHRKLQVLGCGFRVVTVQFGARRLCCITTATQQRSTGRTSRIWSPRTGGIGSGMRHERPGRRSFWQIRKRRRRPSLTSQGRSPVWGEAFRLATHETNPTPLTSNRGRETAPSSRDGAASQSPSTQLGMTAARS
jgi:hypothetical protein